MIKVSFADGEPELHELVTLFWEDGSKCNCIYAGLDRNITPLPTHWKYVDDNKIIQKQAEEIERLKADNIALKQASKYSAEQAKALRTKFNGLVKELKKACIAVDKTKSGKEYLVAINKLSRDVQSILTKYTGE